MSGDLPRQDYTPNAAGRWPANVVLGHRRVKSNSPAVPQRDHHGYANLGDGVGRNGEMSKGRKIQSKSANRWTWEQAHGPIPPGHEIHHIDRDPLNNDLSNLQLISAAEHDDLHQREREDHKVIAGVEHRRCQRCDTYRPLDQFHVRRAGTRQGYCRVCAAAYLREWRRRRRDASVLSSKGE
jgi:hypothetical protein